MPSKCGILNLGISHKISLNLLQLFFHQAQLHRICLHTPTASHAIFPKYSPDVSWRLVWLRGLWLPICVALWLLALCVVASLRSCHCAALCARALCGQGRQSGWRSGGEPVSEIGPYPASEEIDRRPLVISCRQSVKTAVESAAALSGRVVATLLWCQLFAQAVTIVPPYKANDSPLIRAKSTQKNNQFC